MTRLKTENSGLETANKGRAPNTYFRPDYNVFRRFRNTFLQLHCLWPRNAKSAFYAKETGNHQKRSLLFRLKTRLLRLLWFYPRVPDATYWTEERDPADYVQVSEDNRFLVDEVAGKASGFDAPILDMACNCGRHLHLLDEMGFSRLHGVDISKRAIDYMDYAFSGLSRRVKAEHSTIQEYLLRQESRAFEICFTLGATVELVHPSFPLVRELARVTQSYVILMIGEEMPFGYPRFWEYEFNRQGFIAEKVLRPPVESMVTHFVFKRFHLVAES